MSKIDGEIFKSEISTNKADTINEPLKLNQSVGQGNQIKRRKFLGLGALGLASVPFISMAALRTSEELAFLSTFSPAGISVRPSKLFVMDGHIHVMSRQLLQNLDVADRYSDGTVDLPRIIEGGLNAVFFSVYTPEPYYPGHYEVKNTFRVVELAWIR
ncbi:hypothetical protein [Daejeonella sp.]|uniref:hypothetical protein n=1 Tax=Daejeonella sp. TaxID=2805397 RepID=UPI0030C6171F